MATPYTSRSGRIIKKPDFYEPVERPEDDFKEDEYDDDDGDDGDEDIDDDEEDDDEDEDADENGNLRGFIVNDDDDGDCD